MNPLMEPSESLLTTAHQQWIAHVFDHPVTDPAWHWSQDASIGEGGSEHDAQFIAGTFEHSGELLAGFTDAQLNQGFWYLVSYASSDFIFNLFQPTIPLATRLRALRSFVPLFEQVMAVRCSPHLSHLNEQSTSPLNSACYMWWDILALHGHPEEREFAPFDTEVLVVLRRLLAIPHDACRESALHGIGHWSGYYPGAAEIVDDFLRRTPDLRSELVSYAMQARDGDVL